MDTRTETDLNPEEIMNAEDEYEDQKEDDHELMQENLEAYGSPVSDPTFNQHAFLHNAAFVIDDTLRTTFLTKEELGKPLFTVRFMLDLQKIALSEKVIASNGQELRLDKIARYWKEKIMNITDSGMSLEGFSMNLNVTQKREATKKRFRDVSNLKNQNRIQSYGR